MAEPQATLLQRLRASALAFPLAVVVAALMLAISEIGYHQALSQLTKLVHRGQARLEITRGDA